MRKEELAKKAEILRLKAQGNNVAQLPEDEKVPLAMLHLDDHFGGDQVSKL